eukprot:s3889_g2.t1
MRATRIGEASHPGPAAAASTRRKRAEKEFDIGGIDLAGMIRPLLEKMLKDVLRQILGGQGLGTLFSGLVGHQNKLKKKTKKPKYDPTKRGCVGKAQIQQCKATDTAPTETRRADKGKGKAKGKGKDRSDEWTLVQRKQPQGEWQLRQKDWDCDIVKYDQVAQKLRDATSTLKAVVLVTNEQVEVLKTILEGGSQAYGITAVVVGNAEGAEKIPGEIQGKLSFKTCNVWQLWSTGVQCPRAPGGTADAFKVKPKEIVVLAARIYERLVSQDTWTDAKRAPQKFVHKWFVSHSLRAEDSWGWQLETIGTKGRDTPKLPGGQDHHGDAANLASAGDDEHLSRARRMGSLLGNQQNLCPESGLQKPSQSAPLTLRAEVITHLGKHQERYVQQWNGEAPDGTRLWSEFISKETKTEAFAKYFTLSKPSTAWAGELEASVLGRQWGAKQVRPLCTLRKLQRHKLRVLQEFKKKGSTVMAGFQMHQVVALHTGGTSGFSTETLLDNIRRDSRDLARSFPQLRHFCVDDYNWAQRLQTWIDETAAFELSQRLANWKVDIATRPSFQRSWVKRRADAMVRAGDAPPTAHASTLTNALHPSHVLDKAATGWRRIWTRGDVNQQLYQHLLHHVPRPCADHFPELGVLQPRPAELVAIAKSMIGKAAGADAWQAADLLRLPEPWWHLWRAIFQQGRPPHAWKTAILVLIDKTEPGDTRPPGLSSVAWRIVAKWTLRHIRPWTAQWLDDTVLGGVFGSSVADAHAFINHDNIDDMIFLSQDLSNFFDSIDYELLQLTLTWLRMPHHVLQVITTFYHGGRRLLTYRGETNGQWIQQERGILQGFPFSPTVNS